MAGQHPNQSSKFPEDMNLDADPHIEFQIKPSGPNQNPLQDSIRLFIPNGIQRTDGVTYSNTDLKAMENIITRIKDGDGTDTNWKSVIEVMQKNSAKRLARIGLSNPIITTLLGTDIVDDAAVSGGIDYARRTSINPNTKALLERINIRTFSLQFTMIPTSAREAAQIHGIVKLFRRHMYPALRGDYYLRYPSVFGITVFPAGGNPDRNTEYDTKYLDSYLASCAMTNNATSTTYHADGAPVETTLSLTFTEYQTLTQEDIDGGF